MPVKAIIYDLDNTIYPVSSIGERLFKPLFDLIIESGQHDDTIDDIKKAVMRTPFRIVAQRFGMSEELTQKAIAVQEEIEYNDEIVPFGDYPEIKNLPAERFLVTTGFEKMQRSKIRQIGIDGDFKEIHIVDPTQSSKKEVFADILARYSYAPDEVLVVGDDPESEIAAAKSLGIITVLYDKQGANHNGETDHVISHFKDLKPILMNA